MAKKLKFSRFSCFKENHHPGATRDPSDSFHGSVSYTEISDKIIKSDALRNERRRGGGGRRSEVKLRASETLRVNFCFDAYLKDLIYKVFPVTRQDSVKVQ